MTEENISLSISTPHMKPLTYKLPKQLQQRNQSLFLGKSSKTKVDSRYLEFQGTL